MGKKYYIVTTDLFHGLDSILAEMADGPVMIFDNYQFSGPIDEMKIYDTESFVLKFLMNYGEVSLYALDSDGFTGELKKYDMSDIIVEVEKDTGTLSSDGEKFQRYNCDNKRSAIKLAKDLRELIIEAQDHIFTLDQRTIDIQYIAYSHDTWL